MSEPAIGDYALLSDCQGSALVSRGGRVDWACLPQFDSPSVFARLLDDAAGHWTLSPTEEVVESAWAYVDETMVLRTEHATANGRVAVTDALALGAGEKHHHIGHRSPHVLIRVVDGLEGEVEMTCDLQARLEYGLTVPVWMPEDRGLHSSGGSNSLVLSSDVDLTVDRGQVSARFIVAAGTQARFALQVVSAWDTEVEHLASFDIERLLADTVESWRSWSGLHGSYDGPYAERVRFAGRVLHALTYVPTGAVIAAPTTSLPEQIGGTRNWDYRFTWVRDASLTMEALWVAACPDEAGAFFEFFATAAGGEVDGTSSLQILYGVHGERHVPEAELGHLRGYRGSAPVRIGNGAWNQLQLDVYGELLAAAARLADQIEEFGPASCRLLIEAADTAGDRWSEPDEGIWETRGGRQHYLYSKLMCWVALDRAVALASRLGATDRAERWEAEADRIRNAILTEGWDDEVGAFTQSFGSKDLDASALMIPIVGFLPADDDRVTATVEAVARHLTDERGFVYRYRSVDGLEGDEGTFAICTFWLAQCFALTGQTDRARTLFEEAAGCANDLGLLAEQVDPGDGTLLGNFPQAFTHIGLVNAAWAISEAES